MNKGFTLIEVSILLVIFLIVAFLVAPLSIDDTRQARFTSIWRNSQSDFSNLFYSINTQQDDTSSYEDKITALIQNYVKKEIMPYKITFLNGTFPNITYRFRDVKLSKTNAVIGLKFFDMQQNGLIGLIMYDVNGPTAPNVWGKDVFGYNIYLNKVEPMGNDKPFAIQKQDCSKNGTGLSCSNYYLLGGSFD